MNRVLKAAKTKSAVPEPGKGGQSEPSNRRRPRGGRVVSRGSIRRGPASARDGSDSPSSRRANWRLWEIVIALVVLAVAYSLITEQLRLAPIWLVPGIVAVLLVALTVAHFRERMDLARSLAIALACVGMLAVQSSVIALVYRLLQGDLAAPYLLRDAALLWITNVIVYGLWYWELDGGGPHARHLNGYRPTDLLFPQTMVGGKVSHGWAPDFVDYLFVAFNASTAFSPTDTSVLSVRAKLLMMAQSLTSIVLLAVVAARAINILH
jgi:hypothetical protein